MEFKELIRKRRSVRKFSERKVERSTIQEVLMEVARFAPSSRNSHSTRFMVVDNPTLLERISEMRDYGSGLIKRAPMAILVMGDQTKTDLWQVNCSISTTMLLQALVDAGLKGCWVHVEGRPVKQAEPDGMKAEEYLRQLLPIPEEWGILCVVACGYSDFEPAPLPEWHPEETISFLE
uniref:nitroreductase family protein n=1 Tax=Alistipes sp. TaxID=1872444 RepID=UPI0040559D88